MNNIESFWLYFFLVLVSSCKTTNSNKSESVIFNHRLLSIEYPSDWIKIDNEELLLGIKKHDVIEAEFANANPNIIISAIDTFGMKEYGHNSVAEYAAAFIEYQKEYNKKWTLTSDLDSIQINNVTLYTSSYDVESTYKLTGGTFMQHQTHFHFESLDRYVLIAITVPADYKEMEVYDILNTITVPEYTPINSLLND